MAERVVGVLSAIYFADGVDVLGEKTRLVRTALRGEVIDVDQNEEKRLDSAGALLAAGADSSDAFEVAQARLDAYRAQRGDQEALARHQERISGQVVVQAPVDSSPGDLAQFIAERKLTVDETIALAEGDPERARRVLEAENLASGGKPRAGVEQGLQKIEG